jgi:hypothetical protein
MKNLSIKKTPQIKTSFDAKTLTNFSGIIIVSRFMEKLGLSGLLDSIDIKLHHNKKYATSQILNLILLGIISGLNRVSKMETFSRDPLVQNLIGITEKLDADTIFNRIKRFSMRQNNQLMDIIGQLSGKVHGKLGTTSDILDLDSTVRTVYGNQEGAEEGYNPKKKGANSYHPLLGFLNSTKECLLSWFRPGSSYTSNNSAGFLTQAFAMLPKSIEKLLVRADSGFFGNEFINVIESRENTEYVIKVKLKNLHSLLAGQSWESIPGMSGWSMTEFMYQAEGWKTARKFSAVRKETKKETEEGKTGKLFIIKVYDNFCYVTNIDDSPLAIHSIYGDRGTSENWIEAVKNQMFGGSMMTKEFWANETLWQMSVLAYNLSVWMRKLSDESSWREEPATFRSWFVQLAGKIVTSGRSIYLKMYEAFYYKDRWLKIEEAVDTMHFA